MYIRNQGNEVGNTILKFMGCGMFATRFVIKYPTTQTGLRFYKHSIDMIMIVSHF